MKIAVLITCHNRRDTTLSCLQALFKNELPEGFKLKVILVDDGSSDKTSDAVRSFFPEVKILTGDGDLFWNKGMYWAFETALKEDYDAYLWLNDDTALFPTAITNLTNAFKTLYEDNNRRSIVVGSTCDPASGSLTHGGFVPTFRWLPLFRLINVEPDHEALVTCTTMNGNCVFIPREVSNLVGNLDRFFEHGTGDVDYGLRARKLGVGIYVCPGFVGTCARNSEVGTFRDRSLPRIQRIKNLHDRKQSPFRSRYRFVRRHGGILWPFYLAINYLRAII